MAGSRSGSTASPRSPARLGLKPGDRLAMSVGNRFEFIEVDVWRDAGRRRAGAAQHPAGADVLDYIVKDAGCVAAVVEPAAIPAFVAVVERAGLAIRLGLGGVPAGWLDYEQELMATPAAFDPPTLPGRPSLLPALHLGLDRPAQGRDPDPCRADVVDPARAIAIGRCRTATGR